MKRSFCSHREHRERFCLDARYLFRMKKISKKIKNICQKT